MHTVQPDISPEHGRGATISWILSLHTLLYHNRIDMVHDVFGRERHKLHSDNMGGVGSFEKDCRTLYVGRLGKHKELENILWKEFGEWGEVEVWGVKL